jgi:formylglycine-generating enzyme required for sulfatase activity
MIRYGSRARSGLLALGVAGAVVLFSGPGRAVPAVEAAAGDALPKVMRNPKDGAEMVLVPAGPYLAENIHLKEPVKRNIGTYYLYRHLVTIAQYRKFCEETERKMPAQPRWKEPSEFLNLLPRRWFEGEQFAPVSNIAWKDAAAYCRWAGVTISTDGQWEKAAWGEQGSRAARESPYGVEGQVIPLRQWCEFTPDDLESPHVKDRQRADLHSIRGTYGPFDPNPNEHSSITSGVHGMSFRGARVVRL